MRDRKGILMKVYLVGGAIRDELLGQTAKEQDWVVVGATPAELLAQGFKSVGKDFPVFLHPNTKEEYALARTERKTSPGYTGFEFNTSPHVTLEEDLSRRDLTINAMAKDNQGHLIDPFNGFADLKNKVLRHVSPAFIEDPVRLLRIARFAARFDDFTVAEETKQLLKKIVSSGEVNALVAERVWQELYKTLQANQPVRFFEVLEDCQALSIIFPFLTYNQQAKAALQNAASISAEPIIRFAVLFSFSSSLDEFNNALTAPKNYLLLAKLIKDYALSFINLNLTSGEEILTFLEKLDAFRRPERFKQFTLCMQAYFSEKALPCIELLLHALQLTKSLSANAVNSSLQGKAIAAAIHQLRLETINKFLN
ncbi:MAG: hypothetical protein A3E87_10050 [Gammaproteobacteria bacterium RIFCSPHIGHO2_12_FULL_35_23]|nr:MAG: hypothetical protein A3E87_10050 [Gammaproteobacteria bacterium RIFCSPHIGHO2_12_FULL_35_23]